MHKNYIGYIDSLDKLTLSPYPISIMITRLYCIRDLSTKNAIKYKDACDRRGENTNCFEDVSYHIWLKNFDQGDS